MIQLVRDRARENEQAKGEVLRRGVGKGINPFPGTGKTGFWKKTRHLHALRPGGLGG